MLLHLALKTSVSGPRYLALRAWVSGLGHVWLTERRIMRQAASLSLGETCVGVMVAGGRWSVISVADSTIENAPRTSADGRMHACTQQVTLYIRLFQILCEKNCSHILVVHLTSKWWCGNRKMTLFFHCKFSSI